MPPARLFLDRQKKYLLKLYIPISITFHFKILKGVY